MVRYMRCNGVESGWVGLDVPNPDSKHSSLTLFVRLGLDDDPRPRDAIARSGHCS